MKKVQYNRLKVELSKNVPLRKKNELKFYSQ